MVYYLRPTASYRASPRRSRTQSQSRMSLSKSPLFSEDDDDEMNFDLGCMAPYLCVALGVTVVLSLLLVLSVNPSETCMSFLTTKDDEDKVVVSNAKVVLFSLLVGSVVALLCYLVHSNMSESEN